VTHRQSGFVVRQEIRIERAVGGAALEARVRRLGAMSVSRFDDGVRELRCVLERVPGEESAVRLTLTAELAPPHPAHSFTVQGADLERLLAQAFARLQRELRRTLAAPLAGLSVRGRS
jgi:hypothetical protein